MKKFLSLILTTITLLSFTSCASGSKSSKLSPEEIFNRQATDNAQAYLTDKYGFTAKVIKCSMITEDTYKCPMNYNPGEDAEVRMDHNGEPFIVIISGLKDSLEGRDSYQDKAITDAVSEMIEKDFGSDNTTTYSVFNKIDNTITDNGLRSKSQYYDGTNLKDMLYDSGHRCIEVYDKDISDENAFRDIIDTYSKTNKYFELCIVSYKDAQKYNSHVISGAYLDKAKADSYDKLSEDVFKSNSDKISSYRRYFGDGTSEYVSFDKEPASETAETSSSERNIT